MFVQRIEDSFRRSHPFGDEALRPEQREQLTAAIAGLTANWSVDLHYDVEGEAAIVIMSDELDDTTSPTLVVRTDQSAFHLEELRDDEYYNLGDYRVWADLLHAVQVRLTWEMSCPTTLH